MHQWIEKRDNFRSTKKDCSWFVSIEKHAVLIEVRGFGDPHFDKTRRLHIIKKLLYLLNLSLNFAAAILSSAVNLYRFQDVHLRRMFHPIAKDLCPIADEVPLVTSSLLTSTPEMLHIATGQILSVCFDLPDCNVLEDFATYKYIMKCIRDKDEMVAIEGFRSLEKVVGISITELNAAIDVMRRILRSHKPVLRFSAFRALQKVIDMFLMLVNLCLI
ncbi:hypothetical protein AAHA92_03654 [Salvia divinorum]|uniref:Uncharacterized protein n=1 Tax=Salvia divinorum TaxID=28513 RepID=A0ABD1IKB8_SALDI